MSGGSYIGNSSHGIISSIEGSTISNVTLDSTVTFPAGTIIKIEQFDYTTQFYDTSTANTWLDITGFTYTFTPTYDDSKVLIFLNLGRAGIWSTAFRVLRDGTPIGAAGSLIGSQAVAAWLGVGENGGLHAGSASGVYLDNPQSNSGLAYKVQGQTYSTSHGINVNRGTNVSGAATYQGAFYSNLIFMEVSG